ncbi:MAG: outer membrane protein assembly factor BamE [Bermanella sp.]|jgi:outer membrane protein assembly factor BamE
MKVKDLMMKKAVALLAILAPLFACSTLEFPGVYRLQIEQGNIVDEEMVKQLEPGMSTSQVEFILGTPLIRDSFSPNRWDYLHMVRRPDNSTEKQRLTIYFDEGVLSHYESTIKPTPVAEVMTEQEEVELENEEAAVPAPAKPKQQAATKTPPMRPR